MFKYLINILLQLSHSSVFGERIKYRLKSLPFEYEYLNWNFSIYTSKNLINKKEWKKTHNFNRYSFQDLPNEGIADPFVFFKDCLYLFFEAIVQGKGEIWYMMKLGEEFKVSRLLVKETHLSYPYVFEEKGEIYMIPESNASKEVNLYKFEQFPQKLVLYKNLKKEVQYVDVNFLKKDGYFFWFVYDVLQKTGKIFYSKSLEEEWELHPESKKNMYRNAGPFFRDKEKVYWPVQKSENNYGEGVSLLLIEKLTNKEFQYRVVEERFLSKQKGMSLHGTHHISSCFVEDNFIIAVDGKNRNFFKIGS